MYVSATSPRLSAGRSTPATRILSLLLPVRAPASPAHPPSGGGLGEGPGPTRSVGGGPLRCLSLPLLVAGGAADDPHPPPAVVDLFLLPPPPHRRAHPPSPPAPSPTVPPSSAHWPLVLLPPAPVRAPASPAQPRSGGGLGGGRRGAL